MTNMRMGRNRVVGYRRARVAMLAEYVFRCPARGGLLSGSCVPGKPRKTSDSISMSIFESSLLCPFLLPLLLISRPYYQRRRGHIPAPVSRFSHGNARHDGRHDLRDDDGHRPGLLHRGRHGHVRRVLLPPSSPFSHGVAFGRVGGLMGMMDGGMGGTDAAAAPERKLGRWFAAGWLRCVSAWLCS